MKTLILTACISACLMLFTVNSSAQHSQHEAEFSSNYNISFQSKELDVINNTAAIEISIIPKKDMLFRGQLRVTHTRPDNSVQITVSNSPGLNVLIDSGQKVTATLTFRYEQRPLFYKEYYIEIEDTDLDGNKSLSEEQIFLYYTPYNTLEVWNYADFTSLKRSWLAESSAQGFPSIYISKDSIPQSDISDNLYYENGQYNGEIDIRHVFIDGLGYSIPMINDTSLIDYEELSDDGVSYDVEETNLKGLLKPKRNFKGRLENVQILNFSSPSPFHPA